MVPLELRHKVMYAPNQRSVYCMKMKKKLGCGIFVITKGCYDLSLK